MAPRWTNAFRDAYSGLPAPVWMLSAVLLVNRCGSMVLPFLSIYLTRERGMSETFAGQLLGTYGLGAIAGSWLGGWASDRLGPIRVQWISLVLSAAGFLLVLAAAHPAALVLAVLFLSVVGEALRPAVSLATVHFAPPAVQTKGLALNRLAVNLGMSCGPVLGGVLAAYDFRWLFWTDAATSLAAAGVLLAWFGASDPTLGPLGDAPRSAAGQEATPAGRGGPERDAGYLAFLGLLVLSGLVFFQLTGAYPLYLVDHYGLNTAAIGWLFTINTLTIVAFEMVLIHRLAAVKPLRLVAIGALLVGLGFGLLPWGRTWWFAAGGVLIWTLGEMLMSSPATSYVVRRAPQRRRAAYLGLFTAAFAVSHVGSAVLGMPLYAYRPDWVWHACGLASLAATAGFLVLAAAESRRASPPGVVVECGGPSLEGDQSPAAAVPLARPVANPVDVTAKEAEIR